MPINGDIELPKRRKSMFKPMYDRLYVEKLEDKEEKSSSGLIMSTENKSAIARGKVIEAGFGYRVKYDEVPCPLHIKDFDIIIFPKYSGIDAGDNHVFLKEEEVLAVEVPEVDQNER
jgi:chaperonin GroES